jgi:hypothetical protein
MIPHGLAEATVRTGVGEEIFTEATSNHPQIKSCCLPGLCPISLLLTNVYEWCVVVVVGPVF